MLKLEQQSEIRKLFDLAESKLKVVEHLDVEVPIPAVNELRYSGYHLIRALCQEDQGKADENGEMAIRHAKRAIYDAVEGGIIFFLEKIKRFSEDYRNDPEVTDVLGDYVELCMRIDEAREFIGDVAKNSANHREDYYENTSEHFNVLFETCRRLDRARPEINKKIKQRIKNDRIALGRYVLALIGVLLTLLFGLSRIKDSGAHNTSPALQAPSETQQPDASTTTRESTQVTIPTDSNK